VQYDDGGIEKFVRRDYICLDEDEGKKKGAGVKSTPAVPAAAAAKTTPSSAANKSDTKPPRRTLTQAERQQEEDEKERLAASVKLKFPSQIFVRQWSAGQVQEWITNHVKLPEIAKKFEEWKMNGEMIMDPNWTVAQMQNDLSDEDEGMGIKDEQQKARVMAFIKALRETRPESRKRTLANYYAVWGDADEVGDEEGDTA
jgi:hypothetical protein